MSVAIHEAATLSPNTLDFLERGEHRLLIGGEWVTPRSGEYFDVFDPATGGLIARAAAAGEADVDAAVQAARAAFAPGSAWRRISPRERGELLWRLADLLIENEQELAELETLDNGKPLGHSRGSVRGLASTLRYFAGWTTKIEGSVPSVSIPDTLNYTRREPVGVCALIIPWNYPLNMIGWKLGPALACGNTTILKPAEETPLSALRVGELIAEAGFPPGVVNLLTGFGVPTGAALVAHLGVYKVAFTGSTEVGRDIVRNAADHLKKVSLELGGKSPNIIFADADLERAAEMAMWAVFGNAGQICTAGSRLFIERSVFDEVLDRFGEASKQIKVGHGWGEANMGPVVSETQLRRVLGYIEGGRVSGIELRSGGGRIGDVGYFVEPTIFTHDAEQEDLPLIREEIFGPVVAVTAFDETDEVAARANDSYYGLAAGIWTRDISRAHRLADRIQAGTVWINSFHLYDTASPFGGYKASGIGREMGKEVLDLYTQTKSVWVAY